MYFAMDSFNFIHQKRYSSVKKILNRVFSIVVFLFFIFQSMTFAASSPINMTQARSGISQDNVRIVLQFDTMPVYQATVDSSGKNINVDFSGVDASKVQNSINVDGDVVQSVNITNTQSGCRVTIALNQTVPYNVNVLQNPARVFIDVKRYYEHTLKHNVEDGLDYITYDRYNENGLLKAYALDIDPTKFELIPVLGGGRTLGKSTVSSMVRYYNAKPE